VELLGIILISIILGVLVAAYRQFDGHRLFRKCALTDRTARADTWNDVFTDKRQCDILVTFQDGLSLYGYPEYYSDDPRDGRLFLQQAKWISTDENGNQIEQEVPDPGVLVMPVNKIAFIQFIERDTPSERNEVE